jgi:hypothetical protein
VYLLRLFAREKRVTGKQPLGTMLAVTSPPLLACAVDGHTLLWKLGNQQSAPSLNVLFIKKFTGHACPPGDDICLLILTIFAGQTVKFYRSVTGTYFEAWLQSNV